MEPETLEARISECPGGARAGPEPEPGARGGPLPGGGGVRGAPSSRPAPGLGGAVPQAAPSDPGVKTPPAAPPTHPIPGRRPPEGSELSWTPRPEPPNGEISPQTPSGPDFSTQERTLSRSLGPREVASKCIAAPQTRAGRTLRPLCPEFSTLWLCMSCFPSILSLNLQLLSDICSFSRPGREHPLGRCDPPSSGHTVTNPQTTGLGGPVSDSRSNFKFSVTTLSPTPQSAPPTKTPLPALAGLPPKAPAPLL